MSIHIVPDENAPADEPMLPDHAAFAAGWDAAVYTARSIALGLCPHCQASPCVCPPPPSSALLVTAQMLADIWVQDEGPLRVAEILRRLPDEQYDQLATGYLKLLRERGHRIHLRIVRGLFQLTILQAA